MEEIFDSALRSAGDFAGVFEYDGETSYFYLYAGDGDAGWRVVDSIHILSGKPDFTETDITIRWDSVEEKVGLFIKGVLWAAFDCGRRWKYGGGYRRDAKPSLPGDIAVGF